MSDSAANSTAPPDGSLPPPGGESSKSAIPPSTKLDDNSPPSKSSPSPPSSELGSPPPSSPPPNSPPPPLQSPPPSSSDSSPPPPSHPPPLSKSPPSSESPATSPPPAPTPPRAPPVASPPPPSSSVSPPPAVFLPPPNSSKASPPPPHAETPSTAPPPPGVTPSPPVPGAVIQPPPPPVTESITPPTPPATDVQPNTPGLVPPPPTEILLTPPGSDSPPVRGGSPSDLSSPASSDAKSSNTPSTPPEKNGEISSTKVVAGGVVAAAVLLGLIALFFAVRGRRKRQKPYASHYMPPSSFTVNTDGFYYGHTRNSMGFSGNHSYGSQPRHSAAYGDSFGSQMGNANSGGLDSGVISSSKSFFAYDEVMEMTNGFARQNIIGEGGFGCVYKGWMPDGRVVAVKQLKAGSGQGDREFKAEVEIISRVHHRHLVSLVGYSISDRQRMLIYEFVPNNTLEHHLHAQGLQVLDWPQRLKIAIGSAKGLAYLHEDCHPKIIHRDIKSANILLDDDFEAQVADFGLARLNDTTQTHVSTRVMGTFGYLAPEYASSGKLTDRSDVYSFGVVLLELITGRKPVDPTQPLGDESLVEWARPQLAHAVETGNLSELVDPRLEKHYVESEMFRMVETAAACVRHSAPKRPRMVQVVRALDCDSEMSDLSNGVKYGQSKTYDSGLYNEEIMKFRRMALGSRESSEFNTSSEGYTSNDSETRAMNQRSVDRRHFGGQSNYDNRHF